MGMIPAEKKIAVYCAMDTNAAFAIETLRVYVERDAYIREGGVADRQEAGMP
jgi:hypothetical protein